MIERKREREIFEILRSRSFVPGFTHQFNQGGECLGIGRVCVVVVGNERKIGKKREERERWIRRNSYDRADLTPPGAGQRA